MYGRRFLFCPHQHLKIKQRVLKNKENPKFKNNRSYINQYIEIYIVWRALFQMYMLVPITPKLPYTYGHHHNGMGPHN